jgi:hypothetical protein
VSLITWQRRAAGIARSSEKEAQAIEAMSGDPVVGSLCQGTACLANGICLKWHEPARGTPAMPGGSVVFRAATPAHRRLPPPPPQACRPTCMTHPWRQ